jgi:hypothetical protein
MAVTYRFEDAINLPVSTAAGSPVTYQYVDNANPPASAPSLIGGIGDSLAKRASNIGDVWSKPTNDPRQEPDISNAFARSPNIALQTLGQFAGGVGDVIGEGIKAGYRSIVPETWQRDISAAGQGFMSSPEGQTTAAGLQKITDTYGKAKEIFPEGMRNIEAIANIGSIIPAGYITGKTGGILKGAVTPIVDLSNVESKIDKAIVNGMQKGIKPKVTGKSDAGLVNKFYDDSKIAVRDIVDNASSPISKADKPTEAFSQAVKETKVNLHNQYHQMAVDAGYQDALVDLKPVIDDMKSVAINANVNRSGGGLPEMLNKKIAEWEALPAQVPPAEAEELIAMLNQQAKPFWKDPTSHTTAAGLERIAQQTRKQTFDTINRYEGPGYAELRKRYGAQLAIEKEVTDRATILGRRAEFGFFDLANIPVAAEFVSALTGNPASIAKAGGMWGTKKIMQHFNDPDTIIRKMFKDVETLNAIKARYAPIIETPPVTVMQPLTSPSYNNPLRANSPSNIPTDVPVNYPTPAQKIKSQELAEMIRKSREVKRSPSYENPTWGERVPMEYYTPPLSELPPTEHFFNPKLYDNPYRK